MIQHIDKIFLLHCPDQVERLDFQKFQFELHNLEYEIHNCESIDKANGFMNKSIKSCYLSHIKIIEKIIDLNSICLILEDDAGLLTSPSSISQDLDAILKNENEWDMIYLYPPHLDGSLIKKKNKHYSSAKLVLNTHAYIINPLSIKKIHKALISYYDLIDSSESKYITLCHIDRIYAHKLHEHLKVFCTNDTHFTQNKKFGSTLGWGWNNTEKIIEE